MSDLVRRGRADLHIHTLASDGVSSVLDVLDGVSAAGRLDVIAITDHERIDAAIAGRAIAIDRGLAFEVVVGEEITTRGGHLLGLFLSKPVRPLRSLRDTVAAVHDQGGIAIPAHPLVPYPLCAQGFVLRQLLDSGDPRITPDAIETFNPTAFGRYWHGRVVRFADARGLAQIGNSDAHAAEQVGQGWTEFPGRSADDLRAAVAERTTRHQGTFQAATGQIGTFGRQLRKYGRDIRDDLGGRLRPAGTPRTGRDLGYPGGRARPPRFEGSR